jgi:hypothetical protein
MAARQTTLSQQLPTNLLELDTALDDRTQNIRDVSQLCNCPSAHTVLNAIYCGSQCYILISGTFAAKSQCNEVERWAERFAREKKLGQDPRTFASQRPKRSPGYPTCVFALIVAVPTILAR